MGIRRCCRLSISRAFTLAELLVGLMIAACLGAILTAGYRWVVLSSSRTSRQLLARDRALRAVAFIEPRALHVGLGLSACSGSGALQRALGRGVPDAPQIAGWPDSFRRIPPRLPTAPASATARALRRPDPPPPDEEIERQVKNVKKSEYMENFIGREFDGVISSLTNFGIFVQLENTVEGLVRFETMKDDYYTFIEESYMVMGRITKKVYKLGDEVKIIVSSVNKMLGKIDFEFIG